MFYVMIIVSVIACILGILVILQASKINDLCRERSFYAKKLYSERMSGHQDCDIVEQLEKITNERNELKQEKEGLLERLAEVESWLEGLEEPEICVICEREETCLRHMKQPCMTTEEMNQEMWRQHEEDMKAQEARRMAYVCDQCGKRGGCYCNGLTSDGEVVPL